MKVFTMLCLLYLSISSFAEPVSVVDEYMELLNDHRNSLGLRPLILSGQMEGVAFTHSLNMANKLVIFSHIGSSARCSKVQSDLGGGNLCGEVIAMGQKNAHAVFRSWINSPGHKAILENARYTHTGLGYIKNANGTHYWTQILLEMP